MAKPPIEYRPKARVAQRVTAKTALKMSPQELADALAPPLPPGTTRIDNSKITVQIDRAKYNAYQRDYKKAKRLNMSVKDYRAKLKGMGDE